MGGEVVRGGSPGHVSNFLSWVSRPATLKKMEDVFYREEGRGCVFISLMSYV